MFYCEVETSFKMCYINFARHGFNKERASTALVNAPYSLTKLAPICKSTRISVVS